MSADVFTALLMLAASIFTLLHAGATLRARAGNGVSLVATVFFTSLAGWQAANFALLDQPLSSAGAACLCFAHTYWLALQIRFRNPTEEPTTLRLIP